jgi:hypothetical protein
MAVEGDAVKRQQDRLLEALKAGAHVTPLYAWAQLGIYRLAARVNDCRKAGADIVSERVKVRNQFGETCVVSSYRLATPAA